MLMAQSGRRSHALAQQGLATFCPDAPQFALAAAPNIHWLHGCHSASEEFELKADDQRPLLATDY
jgi:hypothetical protein